MEWWQRVTALFEPEPLGKGKPTHLLPRWIFLRALGLIYLSAFYSLIFQIRGLIGPGGILPAAESLPKVAQYYPGLSRFWFAPSLFWISASNHTLMGGCWVGLVGA